MIWKETASVMAMLFGREFRASHFWVLSVKATLITVPGSCLWFSWFWDVKWEIESMEEIGKMET